MRHEVRDELKKKGVSEELINQVLDNLDEFEILMKVYNRDANLIAKMITMWRAEFVSKTKKSEEEIRNILSENVLERVLEGVAEGKIESDKVKSVLNKIVDGQNVETAIVVEKVDENLMEEQIRKIISEKPGLRANAYMGLVIAKLGANVDKKKAMEILVKLVN